MTQTRIGTVPRSPHLEGATFIPSSLARGMTNVNGPTPAIPSIEGTVTIIGLILGVAAVAVLGAVLKFKRGRRRAP